MFFIYILALIGLVALLAVTVVAVLIAIKTPPSSESIVGDPYDAALQAAARLQASAWTAVQELKGLGG